MHRYMLAGLAALLVTGLTYASDNGLVRKQSAYSVGETMDRLEGVLKEKAIGIAVRWKHHEKAKGVGVDLRDTEILIFGNPKMGSPLMKSNPEIGIDLPMKALAYQDDKGQVWLIYNDAGYLRERHGISDRDPVFAKMSGALDAITSKAVGR